MKRQLLDKLMKEREEKDRSKGKNKGNETAWTETAAVVEGIGK